MDSLAEQLFANAFFSAQQDRMLAFGRLLPVTDQSPHFQRGGGHLFEAVADAPQLAADILAQPFERVQQGDETAAIAVENRLERQQGGDKLSLTFEGDFDVLQRLAIGDGALEQRGQRQQLRQRLALALLFVQLQQAGGALVDVLQVAAVIPGHDAVVHAVQQAVKLIQMAVGFRQQAVGVQRVTDFAGDGQRQRQIAGGAIGQQATQGDRAALAAAVVVDRRGAERPAVQRLAHMLFTAHPYRVAFRRRQRRSIGADLSLGPVSAGGESQLLQMLPGLGVAAMPQRAAAAQASSSAACPSVSRSFLRRQIDSKVAP